MTEEPTPKEWKSVLWIMRIYAFIIIAVLIISTTTSWLAADTAAFIIMLMALLLLSQSVQPYLARHPQLMKWLLAGLVILMLLGIVVIFLAAR
jgi:hypothetical protein